MKSHPDLLVEDDRRIEVVPAATRLERPSLRVIAAPAFKYAHLNPYSNQLCSELVRLGADVEDFSFLTILRKRFDIVHLHWPEYYVAHTNPWKAFLGSTGLLAACAWSKWRGAKVVWTVHNILSHNRIRPQSERLFWGIFTRLLDGYVCLTASGQKEILRLRPALQKLPGYVIPHGHYRNAYPRDIGGAEARSQLGLPREAKVILFFGTVAPYKNVPELVGAFRKLLAADCRLLIAGACKTPALRQAIVDLAASDPRIMIHLELIASERVQVFFRASDLVVLPYRDILNSGSALLALSFDRPVLVPALGAMPELQREMGPEWVRMFAGDLSAVELEQAVQWSVSGRRAASPAMDHLEWSVLAQDTFRAFEDMMGKGTGGWRTRDRR
jgi:glycosyltransferase involved in cell wall biosynthesis